MFGSLGSTELIIVLVVILIVFGAGKLPGVMRDLGKGISEFKKAQTDAPVQVGEAQVASAATVPAPVPASVTSVATAAPIAAPAPARVQETAPRA